MRTINDIDYNATSYWIDWLMMKYPADIATKQDIAELKSFIDSRRREVLTQSSQPSDSRYMDFEECANYIGRTRAALRGLIQRKQIPHMALGRRLQFDRITIDRWMARHSRRGKVLDHPG